jgi:LacI family transcriptional regulator
MGVTLQDIANMAGVHKSTVDKVIHNRPGVSDKKRAEIKALLEKHHYQPNPLARAMNYQKRAMTIAVVFPSNIDSADALIAGMQLVIPDFSNFNIRIDRRVVSGGAEEQAELLRELKKEKISGAVVLPIADEKVELALREYKDAGIPFVTMNSDLKDSGRLAYVGQNMIQSGRLAARLFDIGMPKGGTIGIVTRRDLHALRERESSFTEAVNEHYPDLTIAAVTDLTKSDASPYDQTRKMMEEHPDLDALFITCGDVPEIVHAADDSRKLRSMKVICYENYPKITYLVKTGKIDCTISGNLETQGRLAMRLLFEYLVYHKKPEKEIYYTTNEILIRENIGD